MAAHAGIVAAVQERWRGMPIAIVKNQATFDVEHRRHRLAHGGEGRPQGVVGFQELLAAIASACDFEQALARLARSSVVVGIGAVADDGPRL